MPKPGNTTQRGYGWAHVQARRKWKARIAHDGYVCVRCGKERPPGSPFDLDHTDQRDGYLGPACVGCNRAAGARLGHANRDRPRTRTVLIRSRNW